VGKRIAAAGVGLVFGFVLSWTALGDPDVIRRTLLFQSGYVFGIFCSAVAVAFVGVHLLRRAGARALFTGERVSWSTATPAPRHIAGSLLFGIGWGVSDGCPGPIATQLGQGIAWSLFTIAGIAGGIVIYQRLQDRRAQAPVRAAAAPAAPAGAHPAVMRPGR
jgi:uncharacterized protein